MNIMVLSQARRWTEDETCLSYWILSSDFKLNDNLAAEWNSYVFSLNFAGIILNDHKDVLVWDQYDSNNIITAKKYFDFIIEENVQISYKWSVGRLWKWRIPNKLKCFIWLCLVNKIQTWNNLLERNFSGPGIFSFCKAGKESVSQLFGSCSFFNCIWYSCCGFLNFCEIWQLDCYMG